MVLRASSVPYPHSGFDVRTCLSGQRTIHFGLPGDTLKLATVRQSRGIHIGDAPLYDLKQWRTPWRIPKNILHQIRRAEKKGIRVRHLSAPPSDLTPLREYLSTWLRNKKMPPLGFATNPFLLAPWPEYGIFVAESNGRLCGFLIASHAPFHSLFRVDLIVRTQASPNGCSELLVATAFQAAARWGFQKATLGLAPLSRRSVSERFRSPFWFRILSRVARRLGSPWYSFAGLEAFKAKFHPDEWQPMFCTTQGPRFRVTDLIAVLRAFAGGSLMCYGMRTVLWKMGRRSF